jgi:5-formaminoimidazole-4-carboxamide-1-(beta)-D-ribofuranosyl 5'-monophosphate synthetase
MKLLTGYDEKRLWVATLGSHSALDICEGAKSEKLPTIVVCAKGRERTYAVHYKSRELLGKPAGCVDDVIMVEKMAQVVSPPVVTALRKRHAIFVPHKSLTAYAGYDAVEKEFDVPLFGNRMLMRAEERGASKDQNYLFEKAGLRTPAKFKSPSQIDRVAIVKAIDERRGYYERAFFLAASAKDYEKRAAELLDKKIVSKAGLESAVIEEFVMGGQVNFNFFSSPLTGEIELLGTDFRRQTNIDGVLRLPASEQAQWISAGGRISNVEMGHVASTVRESLLEPAFEAGERFADACAREYALGIIGPFALQGAIAQAETKEEFVVFDASLRVPGSPGTRFTPYSQALWGTAVSVGKRIAMEIKEAVKQERLGEVVT